jgi:acyl-CoA dehydrogenase
MTGYIDPRNMGFEDSYPLLASMKGKSPFKVRRWARAQERYRSFSDKYVRPIALEVDQKSRQDHDYLNWDFCRRAAEQKMFSVVIPEMFGGQGGDLIEMSIMIEELCAACTGLGNVIAAHYLGFCGLASGMNIELIARISGHIVDGEKRGEPVMISAAHTEPGAGSDVEDEEHVQNAKVTMTAKKVDGGYIINGQKVFISDGHFATWHMVSAYQDLKDPLGTGIAVLAKTGVPGFKMVKHEYKMGQRACPASFLVFEDCFVPDELVIGDFAGYCERVFLVLGTSRVGVAAIGAGAARAAFETALDLAKTEKRKGKFLIDEQWVQMMLADMLANVMVGRAMYISSGLCEEENGMMSVIASPGMKLINKLTPNFILSSPGYQKMARTKIMSKIMNYATDSIELKRRQRNQGLSSAAKMLATDIAMKNANMAIDIAGAAGLEHSNGIEKIFRDAKLLQIYEGTNQINRKHVWDTLIARNTTM